MINILLNGCNGKMGQNIVQCARFRNDVTIAAGLDIAPNDGYPFPVYTNPSDIKEKIDLIIHLENWQQGKQYERLGLKEEYTNILGINIPSIVVPVRPGRNLAIIVEIAAMNNRQKKMGYNAAEELNERLIKQMSQFSSSDLV